MLLSGELAVLLPEILVRGLSEGYPLPGGHLYTWVERDTVIVRCLIQEHNTMQHNQQHYRSLPFAAFA